MALINCRHFNGYKPCGLSESCGQDCVHKDEIDGTILIIHLGALGSVVRSSSLLRKIKEDNRNSYLIWLTAESAMPILENHPALDKVLPLDFISVLKLQAMSFSKIYVVDKSLEAISIAKQLKSHKIYGYDLNPINGAILPLNKESEELWEIGINNHKKFNLNKKTELQLIYESFGFTYNRESYWVELTDKELKLATKRKKEWLAVNDKKIILGINTGCSPVIPYKKLSEKIQLQLIESISTKYPDIQIVLLGGKEDCERNNILAQKSRDVIQSETQLGLRDGMSSVQACDIVISGDSLGMHLAIALGKYTIAWFGPTCDHEIDLFSNGTKIKTYLGCSPCWKRSCSQENMCYDHVEIDDFIMAIEEGIIKIGNSSRKPTAEKNIDSSYSIFR